MSTQGMWRCPLEEELELLVDSKAYGVFANGGKELGLRKETLKQLMAPARFADPMDSTMKL